MESIMKKAMFVALLVILCGSFYAEDLQKVKVFIEVNQKKEDGLKKAEKEAKAEMSMLIAQRGMVYQIEKTQSQGMKQTKMWGSQTGVATTVRNKSTKEVLDGKIICYQADWVVVPWQAVAGFEDISAVEYSYTIDLNKKKKSLRMELSSGTTETIYAALQELAVRENKGTEPVEFKGEVLLTDIPEMEIKGNTLTVKMKLKALLK